MGKTNFTKVEEALAEEMRKLAIQKIIGTDSKKPVDDKMDDDKKLIQKLAKEIVRDINALVKKDRRLFDKLGFTKIQVQALLENLSEKNTENLKSLLDLQEQIENYKAALKEKRQIPDDTLVEGERKKHINKRFNISDEWLPLQ